MKKTAHFGTILLLLIWLLSNTVMGQAQATFTWKITGAVDNNWTNAANWTKTGTGTGAGAADTYPGQTPGRKFDIAIVATGATAVTPFIPARVDAYSVYRLDINNSVTVPSGAVVTVDLGATLNVGDQNSNQVRLAGGTLINNGAVNISSTGAGFTSFPATGIICQTPTAIPSVTTEYGYKGTGTLSISLPNANFANSAFIYSNGTSTNANISLATYRIELNNPTLSYNQATTLAIGAIRTIGVTAGTNFAPKIVIGGTGFTVGTVVSPYIGSLIGLGSGTSLTIDTGTNITFNSRNTNTFSGITSFHSAASTISFTNRGTINYLGASARSGIGLSSGSSAAASVFDIVNSGTLNIDLNSSVVGNAALTIGNGGGGAANAGTKVDITNTGTMTLKNTSTAAGTGASIFCVVASETAPLNIINSGTLNIEGTTYSYGNKTTLTNTGIVNSNSELRSFTAINNNVGGSINFARTAATATTRQVVFNGLLGTDTSGSIGSTYSDGTNTYAVVSQKFSGAVTTLVTNVLSSASTPPSGTLNVVTGAGLPTTISYTSFSASAINNALTSTTTNSGTINTDTASNLNIISNLTTTSNSIIAPGGAAGKGIIDFARAAATLTGKIVLQISGSTTPGVDFDQITNSAVAGTLSVAGTLDITGIYTPAGPVTIDIVTTEATGNLTGAFGTVLGITTGWTVDYSVPGKVQLVYSATSATATTWTGGTSTGWIEVTNWSNGVPDQNSDVTIATGTFQPSPFVNVNIKSLTIDSGATLQVNPGFNFTVKEAITNNGTLTITNNANLIQVDNVVNGGSGSTTVNRNSNLLSRLDYTSWSSPVATQDLLLFSPATELGRFYNYNEVTNLYNAVTPSGTPFATGTGYLIRMPNTAVAAPATQTFAGAFTGTPNNGTFNKAITYNGATFGYNMVGNPYPSTIDAQAFIAANTANIESSLYFWRKVNGATGSAYAVYNPLGATTATPSSALPNGTIQVGQGFFVKAKSASSVNFTNAMRVANTGNQFFKTRATQKDRLWLNLTNTAGAFGQALIGYTADAIAGVDMYDAKYINDSKVALTSSINGEEYTIQGRPAFEASDVVALNFKTDVAGDYTIALDHFDGVFATGQEVYLLDSKTGAETDLKAGSYTFTVAAGVDNARFSLKYQKTLKVDALEFNDNSISVYKNNGTLYVNSGSVDINTIEVYDVQGKLLASQRNVKATTATISNLRAINQVLIVKIAGEDNSVVSKKVMN